MPYLTTELLTSLLQGGAAANEFLRSKIEEGINAVLKAELAGFFGYEKHSSAGWHTGNSRNGSYQRTIVTSYGKITVDVPRDCNGEFQSPLLPARKQRVDSLETTIIQLYQRGVTTRQIAELIEQMYGHYYTPATISKITADVSDQVRLSSFTADRFPSDMPSSFVTRCMSISAATAWPRRLSTSCSALRRMGTRKFSTMPFCRLSRH